MGRTGAHCELGDGVGAFSAALGVDREQDGLLARFANGRRAAFLCRRRLPAAARAAAQPAPRQCAQRLYRNFSSDTLLYTSPLGTF